MYRKKGNSFEGHILIFKRSLNSKFISIYLQQLNIQHHKNKEKEPNMSAKFSWNFQQQQYLRKIVENKKDLTWNQVAIEMNKRFPQRVRTGKQYRERYVNYVQFEQNLQKNNVWTQQEQRALFKSYRQLGTKWTVIAKIIHTKSQNSLKNKFYGALRKTLRKINRIGKQSIKKFNKLIRYQSLIRIMDAAEGGQDLPNDIKNSSEQIKEKILVMSQNCQGQFDLSEVANIIKQIHKFNIATRCYSSKKWKKNHSYEKEIKMEQNDSCSLQSQKTSKQSTRAKKQVSNEFKQQNQLQCSGRIQKENRKMQIQKSEIVENEDIKYQQPDADVIKKVATNENSFAQQLLERPFQDLNNDLQFELCGILHQNYVPQYFDYFQQ